MYCKYCGKLIDDDSVFCAGCGRQTDSAAVPSFDDKPSALFSVLGFFVPLVGLILYFIYEHKQPRRAKSAGKGALIGFVTAVVVSIAATVIGVIFTSSLLRSVADGISDNPSKVRYLDDIDDADVQIGEFTASNDGYSWNTALEVVVTNKSDEIESFYITIEAVDKDGMRLDTDSAMVDRLNPGQKTRVRLFEYVDDTKIEAYKSATFRVLEMDDF